MAKTKIDWCDYVWNPVWGCLNNCKYCYARKIAKRFWKVIYKREIDFLQSKFCYNGTWAPEMIEKKLKNFEPIFLEHRFKQGEPDFPSKPSKIFVNSMSEIYYWDKLSMLRVIETIKKYPQHTFMFLTKFPQVYKNYNFPENCWLGITITNLNANLNHNLNYFAEIKNNVKFISFEPLLDFHIFGFLAYIITLKPNWIIIGAQTNPYKPPKKEWIENIINVTQNQNIPLYLKDNLYKAYPDLPVLKEFPKAKINVNNIT